MARTKRVTAYEVAELCGVSQATVSYVLGGTSSHKVSAGTRDRVLAAARALGYRPLEAARTLSTGASRLVLLLVPDFPMGPLIGQLLDRLAARLDIAGLTLITHRTPPASALHDLVRVTGATTLISLAPISDQDVAALSAAGVGVHLLAMGAPSATMRGSALNPQEEIGRLQADHLLAAGHRALAYAAPRHAALEPFVAPRIAGVRAVAEARGVPVTVTRLGMDLEEAAEAVSRWHRDAVSAVCAFNDDIGIAILAGARACRVSVPGELAVIGVDDTPHARLVTPSLTSVRFDADLIARELVARISPDQEHRGGAHTDAAVIARESA